MPITPRKIISGGQTGADMGGLLAAAELGLETGGAAPRFWLTERGPQKQLLQKFGLKECEEEGYPARTRQNVERSDATLVVGPYGSGGSKLTVDIAAQLKKPVWHVADSDAAAIEEFRHWLDRHEVQILNVAGNRESQSPGIEEFTRRFLILALAKVS